MHLRPVVTPYIFLGVDRVIAEAADKLDESEVLSRVSLVARKHAEYVLLLEGAETARGCQDFHLRLGARQTDQTENRPNPHKCPHFSPPTRSISRRSINWGRFNTFVPRSRRSPSRDRYVDDQPWITFAFARSSSERSLTVAPLRISLFRVAGDTLTRKVQSRD